LVTDTKAAVDKLDTAEEERLLGVAIANEKRAARDYMLTPTEYMDEYKAEDKQWGEVHPDYAAYQNEHLNYYTPNSGGNGFGCVFIYDDGHVCRRPVVKGKIYCSTHL